MRSLDDVFDSMTWHTPDEVSPKTNTAMANMRTVFKSLAERVDRDVPDGRYKAMVYTELELALMWAMKGLAIQGARDAV